jgi:hypothetical protein
MGFLFTSKCFALILLCLKIGFKRNACQSPKIRKPVRAASQSQCGFRVVPRKENKSRHEKPFSENFIHFL